MRPATTGASPARRTPAWIIDAHCHAGPGDGFTGPWDTSAPLDRYLRRCDEAGIAQVQPARGVPLRLRRRQRGGRPDRRRPTRPVLRLRVRARRPGPGTDPARWCGGPWSSSGFCGIKVHRHDARISREVCDVARRLAAAGAVRPDGRGHHGGAAGRASTPTSTSSSRTWAASPTTGAPSWRSCDLLADRPNLYADTSGVRRFDLLEQAVRRAGPHKVLFGSDGPWLHPGWSWRRSGCCGCSPADESLVLAGNFLRLTRAARQPSPASRRRPSACGPDGPAAQ